MLNRMLRRLSKQRLRRERHPYTEESRRRQAPAQRRRGDRPWDHASARPRAGAPPLPAKAARAARERQLPIRRRTAKRRAHIAAPSEAPSTPACRQRAWHLRRHKSRNEQRKADNKAEEAGQEVPDNHLRG